MKVTVELNESELGSLIRKHLQSEGYDLAGKSTDVTLRVKSRENVPVQGVSVTAIVEITEARGSYFDR